MQTFFRTLAWNSSFLAAMVLTGCQKDVGSSGTTSTPTEAAHDHEHGHEGHEGHSHHEAPHGGHLIELGGNHEYHAEMVEDHATEKVTIYILDEEMKPFPVEAESVSFSLVASGQPQSFQLFPVDTADGKASAFVSKDAALLQTLEANPDAHARVEVTIAGVPYSGRLAHHEHDEHFH